MVVTGTTVAQSAIRPPDAVTAIRPPDAVTAIRPPDAVTVASQKHTS